MVDVLAYDIGGANTKATFVNVQNKKLKSARTAVEYFPIWKEKEQLKNVLLALKKQLQVGKIDGLGVTMTAELSDVFQTKRDGVHQILSCVKVAFPNVPIFVLSRDGELFSFETAERHPLNVAAANWAATGWLVSQHLKDCVVVDVGSTSTSIIPVMNGRVVAQGKTDLEKLMCGELVYTGSLRTNVVAIVHSIPLREGVANFASELFALSGDVHLVLGNISQEDYISGTADGRGKAVHEAMARLARVVCADTETLSKQEILYMAKYIHNMQVKQIAESLGKVYSRVKQHALGKVPVVVTGMGKNFLARQAAESINADEVIDLSVLLQTDAVFATPAFGVALMTANMLEGETMS